MAVLVAGRLPRSCRLYRPVQCGGERGGEPDSGVEQDLARLLAGLLAAVVSSHRPRPHQLQPLPHLRAREDSELAADPDPVIDIVCHMFSLLQLCDILISISILYVRVQVSMM